MITCIGCKKTPEKIDEYAKFTNLRGLTPTEYVLKHEGVGQWGPHSRDKFYCTKCYMKAGMPLRRPM